MKRITIKRKNPEAILKELISDTADVFSFGGTKDEFHVKFKKGKEPPAGLIQSLQARLPEYEIAVDEVEDEMAIEEHSQRTKKLHGIENEKS